MAANILEQMNALVSQVVKLQQATNQVAQTDTIDLLSLSSHKKTVTHNTEQASQILECLLTLVKQVDPSKEQLLKRYEAPLTDLTSLDSKLYTQLIESLCDSLLEQADKCIDELDEAQRPKPEQVVMKDQERKFITNNNILKPQHAWI